MSRNKGFFVKGKMNKIVVPSLVDCVRCGGTHEAIEFTLLAEPLSEDSCMDTYSAKCPTSGELILLGVPWEWIDAKYGELKQQWRK